MSPTSCHISSSAVQNLLIVPYYVNRHSDMRFINISLVPRWQTFSYSSVFIYRQKMPMASDNSNRSGRLAKRKAMLCLVEQSTSSSFESTPKRSVAVKTVLLIQMFVRMHLTTLADTAIYGLYEIYFTHPNYLLQTISYSSVFIYRQKRTRVSDKKKRVGREMLYQVEQSTSSSSCESTKNRSVNRQHNKILKKVPPFGTTTD